SLSTVFGLAPETAGMWGGASTHEVAQVVAIGGIIGPAALEIAVLVKLARAIMLAPPVAVFSYAVRRSEAKSLADVQSTAAEASTGSEAGSGTVAAAGATAEASTAARIDGGAGSPDGSASGAVSTKTEAAPVKAKRPPIVPLFVLGFLAMAALRTFGLLPEFAITGLGWIQTVCLAMAMFALGRGVQWRSLKSLGAGPVGLAATVTVIVALIALGGALLLT